MYKQNKVKRFGKGKFFWGKVAASWLLVTLVISACGSDNVTQQYAAVLPTPTAPPTPVNFNNVPDAATVGVRRPTATAEPAQLNGGSNVNSNGGPADTPDLLATISLSGSNQDIALPTFGRPPDDSGPTANITQLNSLLGTPGPRVQPTPISRSGGNGQPSRPYPTPTLDSSPVQAKVLNLRTTKISFQNAYRFAQVEIARLQPDVRLIFGSANILSPTRTVWTFLFVWLDGNKAWKVIYDSSQPTVSINEVAPPGRLIDAQLIDMSRVLDSPALITKAESYGLQILLPIDVVNFQVEGTTHQPCFVMTNLSQGKQVVINAYTGTIVRNEFFR